MKTSRRKIGQDFSPKGKNGVQNAICDPGVKSTMTDLWVSNGSKNFAKLMMINQNAIPNEQYFCGPFQIKKYSYFIFKIFHSKIEIHLDSFGIVILSEKDFIRLICREDSIRVNNVFMVEFDEIFVEQYI